MQQCANNLFGVMGIHLAPESLKVEGFFGRHSKSEYSAFSPRKFQRWTARFDGVEGENTSNSGHHAPESHNDLMRP
jgi:hypothetical protein